MQAVTKRNTCIETENMKIFLSTRIKSTEQAQFIEKIKCFVCDTTFLLSNEFLFWQGTSMSVEQHCVIIINVCESNEKKTFSVIVIVIKFYARFSVCGAYDKCRGNLVEKAYAIDITSQVALN